MEQVQQKLQTGLQDLKDVQRDLEKKVDMRQKLEAQLSENQIVKDELHLINPENTVYKLIGPALVKQDQVEAKATVNKRIEYISEEVKRYDKMITDLEQKQIDTQTKLQELKGQYDALAQKQQPQA